MVVAHDVAEGAGLGHGVGEDEAVGQRALYDGQGACGAVVLDVVVAVDAVFGGEIPAEVADDGGFLGRGEVEAVLGDAAPVAAVGVDKPVPRSRSAEVVGLAEGEAPHEARGIEIKQAVVHGHVRARHPYAQCGMALQLVDIAAGVAHHIADDRILLLEVGSACAEAERQ